MSDTNEKDKESLIPEPLERKTVLEWVKRVKDAKTYFEKDFARMKANMEFAAGIQWPDQQGMESQKYVANFITHRVNQKVAQLYAKDPKAVYRRRQRMDFQLWDGKVESMQAAHAAMNQWGQMSQSMPPGTPMPPAVLQAQALLNDITHGKSWEAMCDRIGRTMEITYKYQCDTQAPDFKYQMKQLVRRTVTTGVGYVRLNFSREGDHALTSTGTDDSVSMRLKRARRIMAEIEDDKLTEEDPRLQQLEQLFTSVHASAVDGDMTNIEERLDFDFPSASSVIVDPRCKSLKGFIGARWIAQQYIIPLEDVNAYFEKDIPANAKLVRYAEDGVMKSAGNTPNGQPTSQELPEKTLCCLWEVFDIVTKTKFFIVDGYDKYVLEPVAVEPSINRFWPIFALTFNDIEVEPGHKVHIYPPSDVELLTHPQKELNRSREELRKHRKGNRPWYATMDGWLTDPDVEKIGDHESNELVRFKGTPPSGNLKDAIQPFSAAPIDPNLYSTAPVLEDSALVVGTDAQQGQPQRHVAATPAVIQEQKRMSDVNSNVDDLDDLLSELARAAGEMMLREFSLQTVKRIAGVGAAWPEENREDFLNELFLDSVAASSGRPNKAVDVANAQQIGPLMLQAGANPWALIQMYAKVLDANLEPSDFAPTQQPQPQGAPQRPQSKRHPGNVGQHQGGMGMPVGVQAN